MMKPECRLRSAVLRKTLTVLSVLLIIARSAR